MVKSSPVSQIKSGLHGFLRLRRLRRLRRRIDAGESDGVEVASAFERVELVVLHPAVLEAQAVLPADGSMRAGRDERLRGVQERPTPVQLGFRIRLFNDGQRVVSVA